MRIPDNLLKAVGFVSPLMENLEFSATAFVVGVPMDKETCYAHLVTAKHVAEAIEPGETVIAMNAKDGVPRYLHSGEQRWFYHPTEKDSVDAAVMPFGCVNFREYDFTWIPEDCFATDERIAKYNIGLGDEIVAIGLFTRFFGRTHCIPIVRTGNIAMMPRDRVPVKDFEPMEAYLAEGRSIGGLSGSPVFVRNTVKIDAKPTVASGLGEFHFLGLLHGHWDLPEKYSVVEQAEAVNMGVAIVVPAKKILEVLYHPDLIAMREAAKAQEREKKNSNDSLPTMDSAAKPFTKSDFEDALRKATRKKQ